MGEELAGFDLFSQAEEIGVVPCRESIAEQANRRLGAAPPSETEAVAVDWRDGALRGDGLPDECVLRLEK